MIEFKEGDFVKIRLEDEGSIERMFFEVLYKYEKNFLGRCSNTPISIKTVEYGKDYTFSNDSVIEKFAEE